MLNFTLGYPLKKPVINHPFGEDNTKYLVKKNFYKLFDNKHSGVDFFADVGTQIFASFPGIIVRKEFHQGMGNVLGTRYGNIVILYAHLSKFEVELGQIVKKGQMIGLSGNSGKTTTEPHLHLEIRDITKPTLKEMVFEPVFEKPIKLLKRKFIYVINNTNTPKTLKFLALRYFGSEDYWEKILKENPKLSKNPNAIITNDIKVAIPNYI